MTGPSSHGLRSAVARLYEVFTPYPFREDMPVSDPDGISADDVARIGGRPLRELASSDLKLYAWKAMTTFGDAFDFKHFLPRLFELLAEEGKVDGTPAETLFHKLDYAGWRTWPQVEQHAIEGYFAALWAAFLSWPDEYRHAIADEETFLAAFAQAGADLGPFLDAWRNRRGRAALMHLGRFLVDRYQDIALYGTLNSPYIRKRNEQAGKVLTWLLAPETRAQLEAGLERIHTPHEVEILSQALDRFRRIPRPAPEVRLPIRDAEFMSLYEAVSPRQPYPVLFATVSGAHLYGFPSRDSDYDVRGAHILPPREVLGLTPPRETIEDKVTTECGPVELVTHDIRKFFSLILKRNGYVLEQLFSPLIITSSPEHLEVQATARRCITRGHAQHYLGFAENQWRTLDRKGPRVKLLLYVFRVLLTGIHLMQRGEVEANLPLLNEEFRLPYLNDLIARKISGQEDVEAPAAELALLEREYLRLRELLAEAAAASSLPDVPSGTADLDALLIRLRIAALDDRTKSAGGAE